MCRQKKHTVNFVKTIKRFFECGNCFRKESTLGNKKTYCTEVCI